MNTVPLPTRTVIISGFPGIGKSHLFRANQKLTIPVRSILDSDSSKFSWISEGVKNPDFPNNYIRHIKENIGKANSIILVSSHKIVRDALKNAGIKYVLVYPDKSLKEEYLRRYKGRGSDEKFIQMIENNWDSFIDDIESEEYPTKVKLRSGQYMSDVEFEIFLLDSKGAILTHTVTIDKKSDYISRVTFRLPYNHRGYTEYFFWRDTPTVDAERLIGLTRDAIWKMTLLEARMYFCKWEHMTHLVDMH